MDFLQIYYYTSLPILTCNLLFYSVANLSTSITSSQNVIRFVSEHSYCDSIIFQNAIFQFYELIIIFSSILKFFKTLILEYSMFHSFLLVIVKTSFRNFDSKFNN